MTQQHPIAPPPELVRQWQREANHNEPMFPQVAVEAAQWGADQELEACCEWTQDYAECGDLLRIARRPELPSLKQEAWDAFERICDTEGVSLKDVLAIRRVLEQFDG
jgi:hypothetical protein